MMQLKIKLRIIFIHVIPFILLVIFQMIKNNILCTYGKYFYLFFTFLLIIFNMKLTVPS